MGSGSRPGPAPAQARYDPPPIRWVTASILIGCLAASISVGLDTPPAAGQPTEAWPALQGGAGHLGAAPVSLAPPLRATWRVKPGGDGRLSTPVLSSDVAVST